MKESCHENGNIFMSQSLDLLTHKQLEMHRCILIILATDALVLKHQAINIHNAD